MDHSYLLSSYSKTYSKTDFEGIESWQRLLELTYAAWRVADLAVDNEILKNRIKQIALDILTQYSGILGGEAAADFDKNINSQIALLSIAQKLSNSQGINFLVLKSEYKKFNSSKTHTRNICMEDKNIDRAEAIGQKPENVENTVVLQQESGVTEKKNLADGGYHQKETKENDSAELNTRQIKLLQIFRKHKSDKVQFKDMIRFFPGLSDRTIRNDLHNLCNKKIIIRLGKKGPSSFYKLGKNI